MVDDDDFDFVFWAFNPTTPLGIVVWIVVLIFLGFAVSENKEECAKLSCGNGQVAQLLDNQCLCVTKPGEHAQTPVPAEEPVELTTIVIGTDVTAATED